VALFKRKTRRTRPVTPAVTEMRLARSTIFGAGVVITAIVAVVVTGGKGFSFASDTTVSVPFSNPTSSTTTTTIPLHQVKPSGAPAYLRHLFLWKSIGGPISPKSVVATNTGLVLANNMMYRHSTTVYNSEGVLRKTVSDAVRLSDFNVPGHPGFSRGAPVEAAVTPDGKYAWISNYAMYGAGFGPEGSDECSPSSARAAGNSNSYVYRLNLATLKIDAVVQAGITPKYVAVSPDNTKLVVTNWCSWDADIIDLASNHVVARVPIGAYPRGIAISPDSTTAYVAVMGGTVLAQLNLATHKVVRQIYVGPNVRHVVIDPIDGRFLYVSLNASGVVEKINRATGQIMGRVHTGSGCRTLAISTDGTALFVVNYDSNSMTMLRAGDLHVIQTVPTGTHPVGVTYDGKTGRVWVAVYTGAIMIFNTK
jgi:YVTN family beta-propeller protein